MITDYLCSLAALLVFYLGLLRLYLGPRGRTDWIEVEAPMSEGWMRGHGFPGWERGTR